ncbi:hypothetical protein L210DRAFT_3520488 [Boletus edulis BED1]|uniref:Uncharacterized protein n=1 Tax=Boletus edulis BED1 TaxID=1328754 RepID=A0AAD4C693_BOLED|nr:hypothetical protein L210DRAFT_3520488 [Boletus edulis BED1]
MGGVLNARPGKIDSGLPPLGPALESSETLFERERHEHTERLPHDVPRLLDRAPPLQYASSFQSGRGERMNPDEAIVMTPSRSRSSASGSDHTIDALRTPPSLHPTDRVIPPFPSDYTGGYVPGSRSPTDIYGNHSNEVVHDVHRHRGHDISFDRHSRSGGYEQEGPLYYIIPGGMNVIFQDEYGNEITRVGDFSGRTRPTRPGPFVVQDEYGKELYRYDGHERGSHRGYSEPQIVQIDAYPSSSQHRHDRKYSSHGYRSDPLYRRGYDHYPDHREYRDPRERERRDHRDHRYRGYADYPHHSEYRDHRGRRDLDTHRDHGGHRERGDHREHGGYGEHGEHRHQGRLEGYTPNRVPSHRPYSQAPLERPLQEYPNSISDDRRSGREYATSLSSMRHREDEADITNGLHALHV